MMLTTSFHTVLWHLRKTNVRRIVWADGVYVNQNDLAKRSAHPSIMGDVTGMLKSSTFGLKRSKKYNFKLAAAMWI